MTKSFLSANTWRVAEVLAMKGWLETRWRLVSMFAWSFFFMAINYQGRHSPPTAKPVLVLIWLALSGGVMTLAGSGVKSQASIGFPEGLAQSTQFTTSLPVSRMLLLAVRAGIGLLETFAATVIIGCMTWGLFPSVAGSMTLADFVELGLTTLLWLVLPYCAALFFEALLIEPLSFVCAGWTLTLLLWLLHHIAPAVDVIRAFGQASPLLTHRLPWSQLATSGVLAAILLFAAVWVVQRREY
jgi:hypothetical protein